MNAQITEALRAGRPIAAVGDCEPILHAAVDIGMRFSRIRASDVEAIDETSPWHPQASGHWLIVVDDCHLVPPGESNEGDRSQEDILLNLAFDGHATMPPRRIVVMSFAEPTELSDALADDAIPCSFVATTATEDVRLAA